MNIEQGPSDEKQAGWKAPETGNAEALQEVAPTNESKEKFSNEVREKVSQIEQEFLRLPDEYREGSVKMLDAFLSMMQRYNETTRMKDEEEVAE